jgi:hypothetical protein
MSLFFQLCKNVAQDKCMSQNMVIHLIFQYLVWRYLTRLEQVHVTCLIVKSEGLMHRLCGGLFIPSCHSRGGSIPASNSTSLQSFTSAEMFPKAHRHCSRTLSSLLLAIKSISRGKAPERSGDSRFFINRFYAESFKL